jgi:membrane protein insertase Oxa1/YidC/SpoIIIJ
MAMTPRPFTTLQSFLVVVFSIAGFLSSMPLVTKVGFNALFLLGSFVVTFLIFIGLYYTRRSPFFYRLSLFFIGYLSSSTTIILLFTLVPR